MIRPTILGLAAVLGMSFAGCTFHVSAGSGCLVDGVSHAPGDSFPAADGCNLCTCEHDGSIACTLVDCVVTCEFNGHVYQAGDTFSDECNTCECMEDGNVGCTAMWCATCVYAGVSYTPGESFPALDGCNTCSCGGDGSIACTEMACACDPAAEWWRHYAAIDPEQCKAIDFACPPSTFGFSNACGCGCEQDSSCPQWFDCMPPAGCDEATIHETCPYSGIAY